MARPSFRAKQGSRDTVMLMTATGTSQDAIAGLLGIDAKTLRKHFQHELENGPAMLRAEILGQLQESARQGKVTAQRMLATIERRERRQHFRRRAEQARVQRAQKM